MLNVLLHGEKYQNQKVDKQERPVHWDQEERRESTQYRHNNHHITLLPQIKFSNASYNWPIVRFHCERDFYLVYFVPTYVL